NARPGRESGRRRDHPQHAGEDGSDAARIQSLLRDAARLHVAERPAQTGPASQPGPRPDAPHSRLSLSGQARRQKPEHGRIRKLTDDLSRLIFTKPLTPIPAVCILSLATRLWKLADAMPTAKMVSNCWFSFSLGGLSFYLDL